MSSALNLGQLFERIDSDSTDGGAQVSKSRARTVHILLGVMWILIACGSLLAGLSYYRLPLADKPYSDLYELYKPSGFIGHGYGIMGSLSMIVGVGMYSIRKRWHRLHSVGKLRNWLTFHIFLCTLGPFLVVLHTAFRFGGIISVAFWSMVLVVTSGIFGRFVYTRIPKTVDGEFISEGLLKARRKRILSELATEFSLPAESLEIIMEADRSGTSARLGGAIRTALLYDIRRRRLPGKFEKRLRVLGAEPRVIQSIIPRLLNAVQIQQQVTILIPFQRLFGYWHVFHLPLATIMFLVMILHIAVAITFGYYWIS